MPSVELPSADEFAAIAARGFADALGRHLQERLGAELVGVYLLGSLAHGGFNRRYSDIDVAVITEDGLTPAALDDVRAHARLLSHDMAPKLSIFWTDRAFALGRFPPLDRADYLDHAVEVFERERLTPPRPSLAAIRAYLTGAPFANWSSAATAFAASAALAPQDRKSYLRALLYPARFVFSFMTGRMASNDDAVAYLDDHAPAGLEVGLIRRALDCRRDADDPDALFDARTQLPRQVSACAALVDESAAEQP
jgi:nucleotidyltransferase-like protein